MSENLGTLDRAARAAIALLVRRGHKAMEIGPAIHASIPALSAISVGRWTSYAGAIKRGGTNRRWTEYAPIKALACKIANEAEALI